jgi:hypothetical protein
VVTRYRRICLGRKKINFNTVFAGQAVGIKEVHDGGQLMGLLKFAKILRQSIFDAIDHIARFMNRTRPSTT